LTGIPFHGNLATLAAASGRYGVGLDFQFTMGTMRGICERETETLRARGVDVIFHDSDGRGIELIAVPVESAAM